MIRSPPIPYYGPISGGFLPGKMIRIQGVTHPTANSFAVNLHSATGDIVFHFNPRWAEYCVVRNTLITQMWGAEERHGGMPFQRGCNFEILILCDTNQYKVAVNGQHFTEFNVRVQAQVVNLAIEGDITVNSIQIEGHASTTTTPYGAPGFNVPSGYAPPPVAPGYGYQPTPQAPYSRVGAYTPPTTAYPAGGVYTPQPAGAYPPRTGPMPYPQTSHYPTAPMGYQVTGP